MQFRLIILALGMFVIGTDGFVIAGLLPDIARATDVTTSSAGQLITIFALVYAIASPILASALGGVERKQLLLGSLAVFVLGNVLVAVSTLYPVLLAGRVIAALGASTFIVRLRIMTIISTAEDTIIAMIVAIAATRTSMPRARGTYRPMASRAIFATYPPVTHPMKEEGDRRARDVKNHCAATITTTMARAST